MGSKIEIKDILNPAAEMEYPSLIAFREFLKSVVAQEKMGRGRNIFIFGIDGIPHRIIASLWPNARTKKMRSVFPTTSSAAWLSCLSGMPVDAHGFPGVIIQMENKELINVFSYKKKGTSIPVIHNIFSDAQVHGYTPSAILGDFQEYDCTWRDMLVAHSRQFKGHKFYTVNDGSVPNAGIICDKIKSSVLEVIQSSTDSKPHLLWCMIDIDLYIHRHGYDNHVLQFLRLFEETALELTKMNALVIAVSDHGLTPTLHIPSIEKVIREIEEKYNCRSGGAGRTRWLYTQEETKEEIFRELRIRLPISIEICCTKDVFGPDSLSLERAGNILIIARGEDFITSPGYSYDHGSVTDDEMYVPLSVWDS